MIGDLWVAGEPELGGDQAPPSSQGLQWAALMPVLYGMALAGVLLALREISAVLTRVEFPGLPSAGMDVLTGWHWPPMNADDILEALRTWATTDVKPGPASWVKWHLLVDTFLFVPLYGGLLIFLFRRLVINGRLSAPWFVLPCLLVLVDIVENWGTWRVVEPALAQLAAGRDLSDALVDQARWLALVTDMKWVLTVLTLVALAARVRVDWKRSAALVSALRVPVITVSVLAFLLVVPGGGALDQLPDILRAQADDETLWSWMVSPPAVCMWVFAAAVWLAGWIAATAKAPTLTSGEAVQRPGYRSLLLPGLLLAASLGVWVGLKDGQWPKWSLTDGWPELLVTKGILVLPGLLVGAWALAVFLRSLGGPTVALSRLAWLGRGDQGTMQLPFRQGVRLGGRAAAAVVLGIGGLAIVRAFVGSALTVVREPAPSIPPCQWLYVGAAATVIGPLVAWFAFGTAERRLFFNGPGPAVGPTGLSTVRRRVVLGASTLLAAGIHGCLILAVSPEKAGSLGAHGVVILVLAVATLGAVLVDTSPRLSLRPGEVARSLGFQTRPVFVTMLIVFVLAGQFDDEVRYHAARLDRPVGHTEPLPSWTLQSSAQVTLAGELTNWATAAGECLDRDVSSTSPADQSTGGKNGQAQPGPRAVPLVLVAAEGGGIRAAYWTAKAMDQLGKVTCASKWIFAASGVSGASVGLAAWSAEPGSIAENIEAMSQSGPLAQNMAAMLLRDLPRGLTGVHPWWRDRGAVFEDAWSDAVSLRTGNPRRAEGDRLLDRHFGALGPPLGGWSPHLILSGTDLQRGCRVVATTLPLGITTPAVRERGASGPVDPASCSASPAARSTRGGFASGTLDVRQLVDQEPCRRKEPAEGSQAPAPYLRVSTAAHFSARFPLVSPSGGLVVCHQTVGGLQAIQVQVGDGGYRDNTGLTALLELWSKLEPEVADHNRSVAEAEKQATIIDAEPAKAKPTSAQADTAAMVYVVPIFVILDNHYRSRARGATPERTPELQVIREGARARSHPTSEGVLEQQVAVEATDPVPGIAAKEASAAVPGCIPGRWFVVAPKTTPEPSVPLGWVLSDQSRSALDNQLSAQLGPLKAALDPLEVRQLVLLNHICGNASRQLAHHRVGH